MKQYNKKLIGDWIKYLRNRAGIQQDELAHILQMSRTNISNYESGRVSPPSTVIFALAELFSVSADFPY